jgi:Immunity protein 26
MGVQGQKRIQTESYQIKETLENGMKNKNMKLKVGDVFTINLNKDEVGFGQIILFPDKSTLLITILKWKEPINSTYDLEKVCSSEILFLGYSLDAKLYHNDWKIIGNIDIKRIVLPYHRLGTPPDEIYITDCKGKRIRECTIEEFNKLDYRTIISPIRYENALKAYYGFQPWIHEDYNKLLYENTLQSKEVVDKGPIRK